MAGIGAGDGHMNDGAGTVAGNVRNPEIGHKAVVAHGDIHAVHRRQDAVSAALLDVLHPAAVNLFAVGPLEALSASAAYSSNSARSTLL